MHTQNINSATSAGQNQAAVTAENSIVSDLRTRILAQSAGNPGAMTALAKVFSEAGPAVTDQVLSSLNSQNVKGTEIWSRYAYECDQDVQAFINKTCRV
ncbi:MAG: hypothetical protein EOO38_23990 [Cytophagaceae bacterium]|jgi:hypothetical protein|nr:MAG: hypothetical protein EOO38_23990 [Cytophagaceae bacterium]